MKIIYYILNKDGSELQQSSKDDYQNHSYWEIHHQNDNGMLHREDGPAIIHSDGDEFWYKEGMLHREDGASFIVRNKKTYYINNKRIKVYNDEEFKKFVFNEKIKRVFD
jgi:hypothetical protein